MPHPDPLHSAAGVDLTARLDEQLLVERIRAGDPLAFETIFRRYHGELCAVAERMVGSRMAAEDVVQEVFLAVWAARERWQVTVSVHAYLRRATRNMALRHTSRASAKGHDSLPTHEPTLVDPLAAPDEQADAATLADELARVTDSLPPRAREVYDLSRTEGLTTRQIAEKLQISPKTVELHITRALSALRAAVERWRG